MLSVLRWPGKTFAVPKRQFPRKQRETERITENLPITKIFQKKLTVMEVGRTNELELESAGLVSLTGIE